jgi:hypothetical protein
VNHQGYCRTLKHSDEAKRITETYIMHRMADPIGNTGKWFAVSLQDGTGDNTIYDSKPDAMKHQHHNEYNRLFIQIVPGQMNVCDAELLLSGARKLRDARKDLMDRDHPKGGLEPINRLSAEDQIAQLQGVPTNLIVPGRYRN